MKKLLLIFLLLPLSMLAQNQYVDSSYTGTSTGTISQPWKAMSSINQSALNAGDSVLFKRGYSYGGSITITRSGSVGNPIVFGAYGTGAKPKFIGNGASTLATLFYWNNRNYLTFDNLDITDPTLYGSASGTLAHIRIGWYGDGTSHHFVIQNCNASYIGDAVEIIADDNIVQYNDFGNLRLIVNTPGGFDDFGANPIDLKGKRNQILNNYFHHTICESFDFGFDGGALEYYNPSGGMDSNIVAYNRMELNVGVLEITGSGNGNIFAYNEFINNGASVYFHNDFGATFSGWIFINNVVVETIASAVGDNLIYGNQGGNFASGQLTLINNVYYLTTGMKVANNGTNISHTYNTYYNFSGGSTIGYTAGGTEVTTSSPIWLSTTGSVYGWNFRPLNSTALSTGTSPLTIISPYTTDKFGNTITSPYYMGVGQFVTTPPPSGNTIKFPIKINGVIYKGWKN